MFGRVRKGEFVGEKNGMFGKTQSEEFKSEQSKRMTGKNNPMFGRSRSEETKRKIGEGNKIKGTKWFHNEAGKSIRCKSDDKRLSTGKWLSGRN